MAKELQKKYQVTILEAGKDFKPFPLSVNKMAGLRRTGLFLDERMIRLLLPNMLVEKTPDMVMVRGGAEPGDPRADRRPEGAAVPGDPERRPSGRYAAPYGGRKGYPASSFSSWKSLCRGRHAPAKGNGKSSDPYDHGTGEENSGDPLIKESRLSRERLLTM